MAEPMTMPPPVQAMSADFSSMPGVTIRQVLQLADVVAEIAGCCYEAENQYKVSAMPEGKQAPRDQTDPNGWSPTGEELVNAPEIMHVQEESGLCCRICTSYMGCLNLRSMKLHYKVNGQDQYLVERPCKCGGAWCCPFEMTVKNGDGSQVGVAMEDFSPYCSRLCASCCCCTYYTKILEGDSPVRDSLAHKYTLKTHTWCCGRVNNCCGATCCRHNLIIDILDTDGKLVSTATKTYAPSGVGACCRSAFDVSNYVLEFPKEATATQRTLLMTAIFSIGFQLFERTGDEDK